MKEKDIKRLIAYCIPIISLGMASYFGLDDTQATTLEKALDGLLTALLTVLGVIGVVKTHDKKDSNKKVGYTNLLNAG